jgi:hypothetical protein
MSHHSLIAPRGRLRTEDAECFFAAGYGLRRLLELMVGTGMKTIGNYEDHPAQTTLGRTFARTARATRVVRVSIQAERFPGQGMLRPCLMAIETGGCSSCQR